MVFWCLGQHKNSKYHHTFSFRNVSTKTSIAMENYVNEKQFDVVVCGGASSGSWDSLEHPSNIFFAYLEVHASPIGPLSHHYLNVQAYNVTVGQVRQWNILLVWICSQKVNKTLLLSVGISLCYLSCALLTKMVGIFINSMASIWGHLFFEVILKKFCISVCITETMVTFWVWIPKFYAIYNLVIWVIIAADCYKQ